MRWSSSSCWDPPPPHNTWRGHVLDQAGRCCWAVKPHMHIIWYTYAAGPSVRLIMETGQPLPPPLTWLTRDTQREPVLMIGDSCGSGGRTASELEAGMGAWPLMTVGSSAPIAVATPVDEWYPMGWKEAGATGAAAGAPPVMSMGTIVTGSAGGAGGAVVLNCWDGDEACEPSSTTLRSI